MDTKSRGEDAWVVVPATVKTEILRNALLSGVGNGCSGKPHSYAAVYLTDFNVKVQCDLCGDWFVFPSAKMANLVVVDQRSGHKPKNDDKP